MSKNGAPVGILDPIGLSTASPRWKDIIREASFQESRVLQKAKRSKPAPISTGRDHAFLAFSVSSFLGVRGQPRTNFPHGG